MTSVSKEYSFEIIWTPGHAAGHICLYGPSRRVLFSGDHVLPNTTPNVSMHDPTGNNSLAEYIDSLKKVVALPVDLVYPGHGDPFSNLAARVQEIQEHHEVRLRAMLEAFNGKPRTAYQIASIVPWSISPHWEEIPPFHRRMAVIETISHLELLHSRGVLSRDLSDGFYWYAIT